MDFQSTLQVKIVIALRDNILNLAGHNSQTRHAASQREKLESQFLRLNWNFSELKDMLRLRSEFMLAESSSSSPKRMEDILPVSKKKNAKPPIEYILDRTTGIPRDAIQFFNLCIEKARNTPRITLRNIREAEPKYSRDCIKDVIDSWKENYTGLESMLRLLHGRKSKFAISDWNSEDFLDVMAGVTPDDEWLAQTIETYTSLGAKGDNEANQYARRRFAQVLYETGLIGWLGDPVAGINTQRFAFSDDAVLSESDFHGSPEVTIHLAYRPGLGVL